MASGLLDAAGNIYQEKSKWGENSKVYTRRFKNTTNNTTAVAGAVAGAASPTTTSNNHQTLANEHVNPVSNDQLIEISEPVENRVVKSLVVVAYGRVKINIKAANKDELINLTETMKTELEQVRLVAKKLEDKEAELTALSSVVVGGTGNNEGYNHSQYSGDNNNINNETGDRRALFRVNSEVGSVTNGDMRPFRHLSVSVANNNSNGVVEFVEKEKRTPKANPYYQSSEFLLGKDRLPPESNKRQKSNSGRKQSKEPDYVRTFRSCNHLLQRLMKHKFGWVFNEPVNANMLGLLDYHDIIKHPMDLGTVKSRLAQNFYKSPMEFADDVRLTFRNAMTYNPKGQDVHVMAEALLALFEERWAVIESECSPNSRYGMIYDPTTPTSRKTPHFAHPPSRMLYRSASMAVPVIKQNPPPTRTHVPKKPKAKDLNKRNMTYEEKQKLSTNLQSLPSEKLDSIVQIIRKNSSVSQHDDEIEVDIDSVDIETLWELDRFVTNYRKNLSKHKRKAELAQQARADAGDVNPITIPAKSNPDVPKEDKTKETTLAGRPVDQGERGGDNASSSSSSSSDSGSSSSDSDSDSSSEDGSDAGHSPRN